jgi:hypothetical protein
MTETTTEAAPAPSAEEIAKAKEAEFNSLPDVIKQAIITLNEGIRNHNGVIAEVKASESKDPMLILSEIREQNPAKDPKLERVNAEITKLTGQLETLISKANELAKPYVPKDKNPEEIEKLRDKAKSEAKNLKDQASGLLQTEKLFGSEGLFEKHIEEIHTLRGIAKTSGGTSGEGIKRPRFSRITVNDQTEMEKNGKTLPVYGKVKDEQRYTFTFLAQFFNKLHPGINWRSTDIADAYAKSLPDGYDNQPEKHSFDMTHKYKDAEGHERELTFKITCEK